MFRNCLGQVLHQFPLVGCVAVFCWNFVVETIVMCWKKNIPQIQLKCIIILFHFFSSRIILRGNRSYCCACSAITVLAYGKSTCSFFQNHKMHLRVSQFFLLKSARRPPVEGRRTGCNWGLSNTIHYNFWFFFLDFFKNSFLKLDSRPLMWPNRTPGDHNFSKLESTLP